MARLRALLLVAALALAGGGGAGAALPPAGALSAAELERIEAYLNGLGSLQATFVQLAPDGGTATGTLYYERPDKMRLDYDPPSELLVIANDWRLVYHDRRLEQVSQLFTSSTPLGFLLEDEIRFSGDVRVTDARRVGDELRVTLVQTEEPEQGQITLVFSAEPVRLLSWAVTDAQGLTTHVVLDDVETGVPLDDSLFVFRDPNFFPQERD